MYSGREVNKMTTLEIILIIALAYSVIAHIVNYINVGTGGMICDFEDLLDGILWPVAITCAIMRVIIARIKKHKKKLDKLKS
jgi:hypothetical protein